MTDQVNMADFIAARSDQLNADDLLNGPMTIKITRVSGTGSSDQPVAVHWEGGEGRPLKPCKTVRRLMVAAWGQETKDYIGRSMTLYRDASVSFGGMIVGGIRVSHFSHLDDKKTLALQVTKGRKAVFTLLPLKQEAAEPAQPKLTAEDWLNQYKADIADCATIEDLMALQSSSAKALAKLQADKPELHEEAVAAGSKRAAELAEEVVG